MITAKEMRIIEQAEMEEGKPIEFFEKLLDRCKRNHNESDGYVESLAGIQQDALKILIHSGYYVVVSNLTMLIYDLRWSWPEGKKPELKRVERYAYSPIILIFWQVAPPFVKHVIEDKDLTSGTVYWFDDVFKKEQSCSVESLRKCFK